MSPQGNDLHWNLAVDALSKMVGYDYALPQSDAMIAAYAEALEDAAIDSWVDVEMAVRVMYRVHGNPGFRPTTKLLVDTTLECRKLRREREAKSQERPAIEGPEKITFAEFRARHPEMAFPKVGKEVPRG